MARHKVVIETTVVVSASVYAARSDISQVRHHFFDRSMSLLDFLKTHSEKKIGIVTDRIEWEASTVLEKAVTEELPADVDPHVRSVILNLCWDRMEDLFSNLVRESTDKKGVDEKFTQIVCMYSDLTRRAYCMKNSTRTIVQGRIRQIVSKRFIGVGRSIHIRQFLADQRQLMRLCRDQPSTTDRFILAEAAYLFDKYNHDEPTEVLLASTDTLLSPYLRSNDSVLSSVITDEIYKRFSVRCDWPERITSHLRRIYH